MDSAAEETFDRLTRLASNVLQVPIAAVTLLDATRQFIKSGVGFGELTLENRSNPVQDSFCQHAVRSYEPFVVEDARLHPLVKENPAVTSGGVLAYAGIPITAGGEPLGAFCIADQKPRSWSERDLAILKDLSAAVESQIAAHLVAMEAERRKELLETVIDTMGSGLLVCDANRRFQIMNAEARRMLADQRVDGPMSNRAVRLGIYRGDGKTLFPSDELPLDRAVRGERIDDVEAVIRPPSAPDRPPTFISVTARPLPAGGAVMIMHDTTTTRVLERKARLNEALYHKLANNIPNALVYLVDTNLSCLLAEGLLFNQLNVAPSTMVGRYLGDVSQPGNWPQTELALRNAISGQSGSFTSRRQGRTLEAHCEPVYEGSEITGAIAIYFDVTERAREADELRTTTARLQALLEHMSEAVVFEDADFHIRVVNRAALAMFGISSSRELLGVDLSAPASIHSPAARNSFAEPALASFEIEEKRRRGERVSAERIELADGRIIERDFLPVVDGGVHRGNLWMHRDVTQREKYQARIEEMSIRDELTGLLNRRGFIARAQRCLEVAERQGRSPILFFVDLNGMKPINDQLGHEEGDRALVDTARLLERTFGKTDVVARLGGDEFVALASDPEGKPAANFERNLRDQVTKFNGEIRRPYRLSVSIGNTSFDPRTPRTIEHLLNAADAQMYEAKRARQARGGVSLPPPTSKS